MKYFDKIKISEALKVFIIVLIALLFRRYDQFLTPQIFAEDGVVFLQEYELYGLKSIIMPYAGYQHLLQRLIAFLWGSLQVNLLYIPHFYSYTSFIITFLVTYAIFRSAKSAGISNSLLYASVFLIIPVGSEIFMNITNIMWITSLYLINFIFIGYKSYENQNKFITLLCIALFSLSGPFSFILSPIAFFVVIYNKKSFSKSQIIPFFVLILCGFIQFLYIKFLTTSSARNLPGDPESLHLLKLFTNNAKDLLFLSRPYFDSMPNERKMIISLVFLFAFFRLYIICFKKIAIESKYVLLVSAILTLASYVVSYWPNESRILAMGVPRYYVLPFVCIAWVLVLGLRKKINNWHMGVYMIFFILNSDKMAYPLPDMQWKKQISEYYEGKREIIEIFPEGWIFRLPKIK